VSFELSVRFGYRARNRSALDPGTLLTDPSDTASGFSPKNQREYDFHGVAQTVLRFPSCFHQMKKVIHPLARSFEGSLEAFPVIKNHEKVAFHGVIRSRARQETSAAPGARSLEA